MVAKKVLFITEGPVDELHLFKSICKDLGMTESNRNFYSYKTSLHSFVRLLLPNNKTQLDDIDLLLTLKSQESDAKQQRILSQSYTDVYIIFDLDPQDSNTNFAKLRRLMDFYTDSSNQGRLYINYPMMQSYKHLKSLPDHEFESRDIKVGDISRYKYIVNQEALSELISTHNYNHIQLYEMAYHHLCKRGKILGRSVCITENYNYDVADDLKIFDIQLQELNKNGRCYVLNTSILIYLEYSSKYFLNEIIRHKDKFRI